MFYIYSIPNELLHMQVCMCSMGYTIGGSIYLMCVNLPTCFLDIIIHEETISLFYLAEEVHHTFPDCSVEGV